MTQRILNAVRTPESEIAQEQEVTLDRAIVLPSRLILTGVPPLQDQGNTGTCVAHAAYGLYAWWYRRKYGKFPLIGEQEILEFYDLCKKVDGQPDPQRQLGTWLVTALRVMAGSGWPLSTGVRGPKISGFEFVGYTAEDARLAIAQHQDPVLYRVDWDINWATTLASRLMRKPYDWVIGGHAMFSFGYDDTISTGCEGDRNSWGTEFSGPTGNCYFPYAYKDANRGFEAWRVTGIL